PLKAVAQLPHPFGEAVCVYVLLLFRIECSVTKLLYPADAVFPQITPVPLLMNAALKLGASFEPLNAFRYTSPARHPRPLAPPPVGCVCTIAEFNVLWRHTHFPPSAQSFEAPNRESALNVVSSTNRRASDPSPVASAHVTSPALPSS